MRNDLADLPGWAWRLIAAVEQYEYVHDRVSDADDWRCLATVLDAVPVEVRVAARLADSWTRPAGELTSQKDPED